MKKAWHQNFKRSPKAERTIDGITFHSKAELQRWLQLRMLEQAGRISGLVRQVRHELRLHDGHPIRVGSKIAVYTSDYEYLDQDNNHIIEDRKGFYDPHSKFRIAVFEALSGKKVTIVQ